MLSSLYGNEIYGKNHMIWIFELKKTINSFSTELNLRSSFYEKKGIFTTTIETGYE